MATMASNIAQRQQHRQDESDYDEQSASSSLRGSLYSCILENDNDDDDEAEQQHSFQSPLERHMVKLLCTSLSDMSTVSLVSDNARSTVSPQIEQPASRLMRPALAKSLSDRNLLCPKSTRLCRWSSESPRSNNRLLSSSANKKNSKSLSSSNALVDQMTADMSRWTNHAPALPKRPLERLFLRQHSDSVLMRPERTSSSSSLSSTNSSTCYSDLEDEIPTPVPSGEDF